MIDIKEEDWHEFRAYVQHLEERIKFLERKALPDMYAIIDKLTGMIGALAEKQGHNKDMKKWWEKEW
tara:strand:- start:268 stop:468 length:201 start_codon:yes stop_codon:yes gene_type:complete